MNSISTRRRLVAVLLLPFLMVLAGCGKLHADFEIQDIDTINVSYDVAIDEAFTEGLYDSAETMCTEMQGEMSVVGEMAPEIEPYEENGQLGCLVTGVMTSDNFGQGFTLSEEDGEYHLVIEGDEGMAADLNGPQMSGFDIDFRMTFTFPGEIIDSQGGEIDGNAVTFTDLNDLAAGIDVRADAGGFPWVIVIVIVLVLGFLLLLALAAVAFFVIRSRKNKGGGSAPTGMPGGYGAAASVPGSAPPAAPQGDPQGQQWGQASPPPAAPQGSQQWGQASPPPAAPQGDPQGQQWGQASPPPAPQPGGQQWPQPQQGEQPWAQPQQGEQPWAQPQQGEQPWAQPQQGEQPWSQPGGQQDQGGQPWDHPDQGQQPPRNPGW